MTKKINSLIDNIIISIYIFKQIDILSAQQTCDACIIIDKFLYPDVPTHLINKIRYQWTNILSYHLYRRKFEELSKIGICGIRTINLTDKSSLIKVCLIYNIRFEPCIRIFRLIIHFKSLCSITINICRWRNILWIIKRWSKVSAYNINLNHIITYIWGSVKILRDILTAIPIIKSKLISLSRDLASLLNQNGDRIFTYISETDDAVRAICILIPHCVRGQINIYCIKETLITSIPELICIIYRC